MENASKALIIAGAVMIAMMITSLGVLIFSQWKGKIQDVDLDDQTIQNFNAKITPYLGARISGSQVNALLQYCLSNNMGAEEIYMRINVVQTDSTGTTTKILLNDDITITPYNYEKVPTGEYYTVEGERNPEGLITTIKVTP